MNIDFAGISKSIWTGILFSLQLPGVEFVLIVAGAIALVVSAVYAIIKLMPGMRHR
jgi:hypothetical protein